MSEPELLRCPFCGDPMERDEWGTIKHITMTRKDCPIASMGFIDAAAWNRRAPAPDALRAAREALEAVETWAESTFMGADAEKNRRAAFRGVRRKARAALAALDREGE
jgi:hypothetical protein